MHDWTENGRIRLRRKKKIKGREGALDDESIQERAAVACAKRRGAFCFVRVKLEQILVPALNTFAKVLREGSD